MMRRSLALQRLLRSLADAGCAPRETGPGQWIAACPSCLRQGWASAIEIRQTDTGIVVCCVNAHEPPAEAEAAA